MFLKSLNITGNRGEIRQIDFEKGVNLIIDNSPGESGSGNNVGKTTLLRLVDFCLAGSGKNIYTDPEFNKESEVKKFLIEKEVLITLTLVKNLESVSSPKIVIERNFLTHSKKIQRINGESYNNPDFASKLALMIFNQRETKPTMRQLIAKNIRDEKNKLNNILKVLHTTTTGVEYETLYQFWLGVNSADGADYQKANELHRKQETYKTQLAKQFDINDFQIIPAIQANIDLLREHKQNLDLDINYQEQLDTFDNIKAEMSRIAIRLSTVNLRKALIEESRDNLEKDISKVSLDEIKVLYQEAKMLFPNLQKSFEESVNFHNQMIQNKLEFIARDLPALVQEEQELHKWLCGLEAEAEQFRTLLHKDKTLEALNKINSDLQISIERHAKLTEQERIWMTCLSDMKNLEEKLNTFSDQAKSLNQLIEDNLKIFNNSLKRISEALYGQQYILTRATVDKRGNELKHLQFEMLGVSSNPGTGEKKGHITAFDLAYIEFAEKLKIPHVNFIMHDQIENVDDRKIVAILEILVPSINCQYIAPILKDKIPEKIDIDRYKVVELSQEEKLFKF